MPLFVEETGGSSIKRKVGTSGLHNFSGTLGVIVLHDYSCKWKLL